MKLRTLSQGTTTEVTKTYQTFFELFANCRFQITSRFYPFPKKLPHGWLRCCSSYPWIRTTPRIPRGQTRAWKWWGEYNKLIGNNNLFLKLFTWHQWIKLVGAFALALREGQFSGKHHDKLVEKTVCHRPIILRTVQEYFWHAWQGQMRYMQ